MAEEMVSTLDAMAHLQRLVLTDDKASLDAGLKEARNTIAIAAGNPNRSGRVAVWSMRDTLADALESRHEDTYSPEALDEAIELRRTLLTHTHPIPKLNGTNLIKLSRMLGTRYELTGKQTGQAHRREALALARISTKYPYYARTIWDDVLINLGKQYMNRFDSLGTASALESAIDAFRSGSRLYPEQGRFRQNLSMALRMRFVKAGDVQDLDEAVDVARGLLDDFPDSTTERSTYATVLGDVLLDQYTHTQNPRDREEAVRLFREAARDETHPARDRLKAAAAWGYLHAEAADGMCADREPGSEPSPEESKLRCSAAKGLARAVGLMPLVAWRGVARGQQRTILSEWNGLTADAAAVAMSAGLSRQAVEVLEQGRAIMWSQLLRLRSAAIEQLRHSDMDLFTRLNTIRRELDAPPARQAPGGQTNSVRPAIEAERRTALAREWETLMNRYDLSPKPDYEQLQAASIKGPVVIVNVSELGCHALILAPGGPPQTVPLTNITYAAVKEELAKVEAANRHLAAAKAVLSKAPDDDSRYTAGLEAHRAQRKRSYASRDLLEWVWYGVAQPVFDAMSEIDTFIDTSTEELPRLWWCPTGLASRLPLHAAGLKKGRPEFTVPGRVVPSYAVTLASLIHARRPQASGRTAHRVPLLITVPEPDLSFAGKEADIVTWHTAPVPLHDTTATADIVTELLPDHPYLHAICHAAAGKGLRLHGGKYLSPERLAHVPVPDAEFAYLSACDTASVEDSLEDEATHLAAALIFAGFRHVIASLYPVQDVRAPAVADSVYAELTTTGRLDPARSARALHRTLTGLRAERPGTPNGWMPYIHFGP